MDPHSAFAGSAAEVWDVLDRLVDDAAELARRPVAREALLHELLRRAVDALAALGGAAWEVRDGRLPRITSYMIAGAQADVARRALDGTPDDAHRRLLDHVAKRREPLDVGPHAAVDPAGNVSNPYAAALLIAPIVVDDATVALLELVHRPEVGADTRQGALRVLAALADCAADHHRERQRRLWQDRAATADDFDRLVAALYDELDSTAVAYAAANDGRRWIGCDRVTVVRCEGTVVRTLAVSGVDIVDRRADQIRLLERLVAVVVREREPLWPMQAGEATISPVVVEALSGYVDHSDATQVAVLPLFSSELNDGDSFSASVGALVVERFGGGATLDDTERARCESLCLHAGRALRRAAECESIPLGRWWRKQFRRRTPDARRRLRLASYAALAAVVAAVPFLIPAEATVEARGALQPQHRRELFAPSDGIVTDVAVRHGQAVEADAPVVVLHKPELNVELTRVAGELQTAERRLAALRATRTVTSAATTEARIQAQDRTAEEEQLKETIRALGAEQELLLHQVRELTIHAPLAGVVTTWDVEQALPGRPVARGQSLLTVADVSGPWVVELLVPERLIGDVLAARREQAEPLEVEFIAATHPEMKYRGRVVRVAESTETDDHLGVVVRTTVAFDRDAIDPAQLRPGAVVTARVLCGDSSLGAVYGRDLWRFLQSWWW